MQGSVPCSAHQSKPARPNDALDFVLSQPGRRCIAVLLEDQLRPDRIEQSTRRVCRGLRGHGRHCATPGFEASNHPLSGPRKPDSLPIVTTPAPLVWIDLEMSGLNPDACKILEIATLVTDTELEVVAEGPDIVVHQPDAVLDAMDEWCTTHHGESGLTAAVKASSISLEQAEEQTLAFLRPLCEAGASPLCGNSIWQDRRFISRYMPKLDAFLHYRMIDVSTIKELARRWYPDAKAPAKGQSHRALDDIRESIAELKFYRSALFR
jgi:oligoribonuclease